MTILVRVGTVASSRRFAFELVKPSSVTVTGGGSETATISALGSVEFSAVEQMYINDVFSSDYDNYMISLRMLGSSNNDKLSMRLSSGGVATTGTDYTHQYLLAASTSVSGARTTSASAFRLTNPDDSQRSGTTVYLYGPALAQPTAVRDVGVTGLDNALLLDFAGTHSLSTAYDGIWLDVDTGSFSGRIAVYGMRG